MYFKELSRMQLQVQVLLDLDFELQFQNLPTGVRKDLETVLQARSGFGKCCFHKRGVSVEARNLVKLAILQIHIMGREMGKKH